MRFLATGDLQCHSWRQFSYTMPNGMNSRLYNCLRVFDIILKEAKARGIKRVLINGDLFEENAYINVEVYDAVYQKMEKLHDNGLDTYINLGNHDVLSQSGGRVLHSLRPFRKVATIIEEPTLVWDSLQVVPWMADPKKLKKVIRSLRASQQFGLVLHCGVQGARTGPTSYLVRNPIKVRDIRTQEFSFVILSDYHTRQSLGKNSFYLGSPLQHTFGETHRPCIWEMVLDGSKYTANKIYTNLPRFQTIRVGRGSSLRRKLQEFEKDYVRIILSADSEVTDEQVELAAKENGNILFRIDRGVHKSGREKNVSEVQTLEAEEAIERYVASTTKTRKAKRLTDLGNKIYRGEL